MNCFAEGHPKGRRREKGEAKGHRPCAFICQMLQSVVVVIVVVSLVTVVVDFALR